MGGQDDPMSWSLIVFPFLVSTLEVKLIIFFQRMACCEITELVNACEFRTGTELTEQSTFTRRLIVSKEHVNTLIITLRHSSECGRTVLGQMGGGRQVAHIVIQCSFPLTRSSAAEGLSMERGERGSASFRMVIQSRSKLRCKYTSLYPSDELHNRTTYEAKTSRELKEGLRVPHTVLVKRTLRPV